MKNPLIATLLASLLALPVFAAEPAGTEPAAPMTQGEVRKLDPANQKITLRHGPIENLGMPPMTMVFEVRQAAMLEGLKAGDSVRFAVQQEGSKLIITDLQPAP
ncbi:MAG: copper-binding protein [Pseudomonadota bacterium]